MGAVPREAAISIAIPESLPVEFLDSLYEGMKSMAGEFQVNLLGGDTTASPEYLVLNVVVVGEAPEEEILYRAGAKQGDVIFLTGHVGSSAAGLDLLLTGREFAEGDALILAHHDPQPHVRQGRVIAEKRVATSLIDVSDGVASDLGHICGQSGLGAVIEEKTIPIRDSVRSYCRTFDRDVMHTALHVGEDYVLLGTVPEKKAGGLREALVGSGHRFHPIGKMTAEKGIRLKGRGGSLHEIPDRGWDHFPGEK
jgi:thiamine-monophosphate kinase